MTGRRRRRTGRVVAAAGAVVVAGAVVATGLGLGLPGGEASGEAGSDLPPATAEVTRQTLVDTQVESGELGYGATISAAARAAGTVTGLPATGASVKRGQALYRLDNAPVVLLYGSLPAYRALAVDTEGADVTQLEKNLNALGYDGFTVDDEYTSATAEAVKEWQEDLGLPETGTVELGRVVFASGEVRVDSQGAEVGEPVQPGTAVLSYTATARVVSVELEVADQRLARKDAAVSVTLPDGKEAPGKITKTELVIKPAEGQDPASTTVEVTIAVDDPKAVAGLDQATVDVTFTASERENVLTVPVAALLALAEGGYGVQVVEGTATRIVAVETGMFATGRVEVSGDGIAEGMTVGMPS
ncbi:peptidoglycan-binding protein [Phytohabitans flavus]|uniref:Peptidoglycan-binding protein n=1 Tax=Phytohabitans flavus TaxID=1076124 RepID=A0A6F8Y6D1_9ACTN|nr:peptidoglycan-binding protein [Phytohabitans flavus]BCB81617.1 peptidoglycan-binding protein [Phytohabitans flavus]